MPIQMYPIILEAQEKKKKLMMFLFEIYNTKWGVYATRGVFTTWAYLIYQFWVILKYGFLL